MNINKSNHYTFWGEDNSTVVDEFLGTTEVKKGKDLIQLASYRRAISNFVNIVTGENIPVEFNSRDQSFTDGKKVTIGANLNEKTFDVAVGLALHEGSHIKLSDFKFLNGLDTAIPSSLYSLGVLKNLSRFSFFLNA